MRIPTPLLSYTKEKELDVSGATLRDVLAELERRFPGIRFRVIDEQDRVRPHMRFFLNGEQVFDLGTALKATDELVLIQALSGG